MSVPAPIKAPPITAADLPAGWAAIVRETAQREGHAVRGGAGCTIEVQSITTGNFYRLMLPGGGFAFTTAEERDAVLRQIQE